MARSVNGVSTILYGVRLICRMVGRFGTAALSNQTTPQLAAAVGALVVACQVYEALDDYPGQIDQSGPVYPGEDVAQLL